MIQKLAILITGILAVVIPNLNSLGLPVPVQATISGIGTAIVGVMALLEHPTVQTFAGKSAVK